MVAMSRTLGTRRRTTGPSASRVAARAGSAAFLAPLAATVPWRRLGPVMRKESMVLGELGKGAGGEAPAGVASLADARGRNKDTAGGIAGVTAGSVPRRRGGGAAEAGRGAGRAGQGSA